MGSGIKVEWNNFKTAVNTFVEQMGIMALEIEYVYQSRKTKAAKTLAAAHLENFLVFQLDNEPIPSVNTLSGFISSSIALACWSEKWKHDANSSTAELSADIIFMNSDIKEVAIAFANAYTCSKVITQNTKLISSVNQVEKKMDLVENFLGEVKKSLRDMKGTFGSMQEMIGRVLQTLAKINTAIRQCSPTGGIV